MNLTSLSKPVQLACGDLHHFLLSKKLNRDLNRSFKPAKSFICLSFTCQDYLSFLSLCLFITFLSSGFREGYLGTKPAALVLLSSLTQHLRSRSHRKPFTSVCPSIQRPQDLGCPGPCLSKLGCTLFLRGGGLRFLLRVGMVVV